MSDSEAEMEVETPNTGLVTPGEQITDSQMWMRGHGTYSRDQTTFSSVAGTIERVNKLLSVKPLRGRYIPVIGDHVIGRVTEVGSKRWKLDIGASQDAMLMLGAVNLPGGILRRKSEDDELQMREFFKEGDLVNAEVQSLYHDGGAALHTRSTRYGKLRDGVFVKIPPSLVLRVRTQVYNLDGGIEMIVGVNGYIWIRKAAPPPEKTAITKLEDSTENAIYSDSNREISANIRQTISRYCNCLAALVYKEIGINETRIKQAYEASLAYKDAGELLDNSVKEKLAKAALAAH